MANERCIKYIEDCKSCVRFYGHSGCEYRADCKDCSIGPCCPCLEKPTADETSCPYYKEEKE